MGSHHKEIRLELLGPLKDSVAGFPFTAMEVEIERSTSGMYDLVDALSRLLFDAFYALLRLKPSLVEHIEHVGD